MGNNLKHTRFWFCSCFNDVSTCSKNSAGELNSSCGGKDSLWSPTSLCGMATPPSSRGMSPNAELSQSASHVPGRFRSTSGQWAGLGFSYVIPNRWDLSIFFFFLLDQEGKGRLPPALQPPPLHPQPLQMTSRLSPYQPTLYSLVLLERYDMPLKKYRII